MNTRDFRLHRLEPRRLLAAFVDLPSFLPDGPAAALTLNGDAQLVGGALLLNPDARLKKGSAFTPDAFAIDRDTSFTTSFSFRIGGEQAGGGGEGLAFVLHGGTDTFLADFAGSGLGYAGAWPSIAVEFDTRQDLWDPSANHVSVLVDGDAINHVAAANVASPDFNGDEPVFAWIDYDGITNTLAVYVADADAKPVVPALTHRIDLFSEVGSQAYAGFTAASGWAFNQHEVLSWSMDLAAVTPPTNPTDPTTPPPPTPPTQNPLSFAFTDFAAAGPDLSLNADARLQAGRLHLTGDAQFELGSAFHLEPLEVNAATSFSTSFSFEIGGEQAAGGAEGLVFLMQSAGTDFIASFPGGGIAYAGAWPSLAIEFDTSRDSFDPDSNAAGEHVAVTANGDISRHLASAPSPLPLKAGGVRHAWIEYDGTADRLDVYLSATPTRPDTPVLSEFIEIDNFLGEEAFVGFTASTGWFYNRHEVLNWTFTQPGATADPQPEPQPGTLALATSQITVDEDAGQVLVQVLRTGGTDGTVTVDYVTVPGTALPGEDYIPTAGTVTFAPGQSVANFAVTIIDDDISEPDETFAVSLDRVTGGAELTQPRTATVTIKDDEPAPPPVGDGTGLLGAYFDNRDFTAKRFERIDPTVDFDWGRGSPAPSMGADTFSIRWTGRLLPRFSETYTFHLGSDDGSRLYLNNQLVIDAFEDQSFTFASGSLALQAGTEYDLRIEYYEQGGDAAVRFEWQSPSQPRQVVPTAQLFADAPVNDPADFSFSVQPVVTGLNQPTAIEFAGDKLFIAQKNGVVRLHEDGQLLSQPFIDISQQVNDSRDRGLLGIAVHPNFPQTPYVYLLFTYDPPETQQFTGLAGPDGRGSRVARLVRVEADAATNYRTAKPGTQTVILGTNSTWENIGAPDKVQSTSNPYGGLDDDGNYIPDVIPVDSESHTIGAVVFGLDGMLYVSSGDGTSYGRVDPNTLRVQDPDSLNGKILRIDPITGAGLPDNPFYDGDAGSNRSKVFHLGLRNPFRIAVEPGRGRIFNGDVGWTAWEEINTGPAGANFGWPFYEGGSGNNLRTNGYRNLPEANAWYATTGQTATPSLWAQSHGTGGVAVVAGDFYTGSLYPSSFANAFFFTDYGNADLRVMRFNPDGTVAGVETLLNDLGTPVEMTMGTDGRMWFVDLAAGRLSRIELQTTPQATLATLAPTPDNTTPGNTTPALLPPAALMPTTSTPADEEDADVLV
ncbi:MAG: PQQ-dependent sugar dehydrogenase [Phycisphaerae bacterium]